MSSQRKKILEHLRNGNSITSFAAFDLFGITRLSAHIHKLREEGYLINREDVKYTNALGQKVTMGRYSLEPTLVEPLKYQIALIETPSTAAIAA